MYKQYRNNNYNIWAVKIILQIKLEEQYEGSMSIPRSDAIKVLQKQNVSKSVVLYNLFCSSNNVSLVVF